MWPRTLVNVLAFVGAIASTAPLCAADYERVPDNQLPRLEHSYSVLRNLDLDSSYIAVPTGLEISYDERTKTPKFGLQYAGYNGEGEDEKTASLTVSYRFSAVTDDLLRIQRSLPKSSSKKDIKVDAIQAFNYKTDLYYWNAATESMEAYKIDEGNGTLDAIFAATIELSDLDGKLLFDIIRGRVSAGLMMRIKAGGKIGVRRDLIIRLADLRRQFESIGFISTNRGLGDLASDILMRAEKKTVGPYEQIAVQNWLNSILGDPVLERTKENRVDFGWLLSGKADRINSDSEGTIRIPLVLSSQEPLVFAAFLPFSDLCQTYKDQILNLDSMDTGCGGLTE